MQAEEKLSRARERQYFRMGWTGKLIEANLREATVYGRYICKGRFSEGEVISFAYDGMMQALKNFDPDRNRFFTWAKAHIRGKIFAAMKDQSRYTNMMGTPMSGGEPVVEHPETGEIVDMPRWTNEPSVDFNHEQIHYHAHYYEEIKGIMARVLNSHQQSVVRLRIWEDLKFREIGESLGFSTSRAQAIYERAMRLIRRELMRRKRLDYGEPDNSRTGPRH